MSFKRNIPNFITLLNLFSGCIAVILAVQGNLVLAALFVALGIFFDFFDGLAARALDVKSEVGLQLDSLADVVTSGVVPGIVMFQLLLQSFPVEATVAADWTIGDDWLHWNFSTWAVLGLLVTLASAYRLAKFNVDERQTDSFIGLPTPANALMILSLPLILHFNPDPELVRIILNRWFLLILIVFSCVMMNAEIPLFALKFKTWGFKENKLRYFFILWTFLLMILFEYVAIPLVIVSYVIVSLLFRKQLIQKEIRESESEYDRRD